MRELLRQRVPRHGDVVRGDVGPSVARTQQHRKRLTMLVGAPSWLHAVHRAQVII
jgi:hypothetical protein